MIFPFLMSREIFSHEVASPQKDRARKAVILNKSKKLGEALALCGVVLSILNEVEEAERQELKLLFRALEIEDQDSEKIEDPKLYGIALNLDFNADQLRDQAEELKNFIKNLEALKV